MQLASLLAGCVHPIGSLLELLHHESVPFSKEALRNCIIDIATRKNFAPKEGMLPPVSGDHMYHCQTECAAMLTDMWAAHCGG